MAETLAEVVQLQRAEEQANSKRVKWELRTEFRRVNRGGQPLRFIGVRLPLSVYEALAAHGMPAVVARTIIQQWAMKVSGR
jgi:hypothetical protein